MKGGRDKVRTVMHEYKSGTLHSGSGPVVKNRKQAIAIALSEAGLSRTQQSEPKTGRRRARAKVRTKTRMGKSAGR